METYFKIKIFIEFGIPIIIVTIVLICVIYSITKSWLKSRLMKKLGYEYKQGLGNNVAYEFQPHWVKDNIKIHWRKIDSLKYSKIKKFVKSKEGA